MNPIRTLLAISVFAPGLAAAPNFATDVYPVLLRANCAGCHNDNGVASATRLRFPEDKPTPEVLTPFGNSLAVFVDRNAPAKSALLLKPTGAMPHAGGKRIEPGSEDEAALKAWIDHLATAPPESLLTTKPVDVYKSVGPIVRRLTHAQYNNTIRDLLNDASRVADQFPPEDYVNGFRNQYLAQNTSPLLAEAYAAAAEKLAKKAFLGGDSQRLIPCTPKSFDDAPCRKQFLTSFGRKAFRRPLQPNEIARYEKLFAAEAAESKQFLSGAQVVLEVMLQSPNFLMRTENGLDPVQRPYEIAGKLSYFLWNSMPDEALLNAAASGELNTAAGLERQARRMLQSPKAKEAVNEFLTEWLRFDRLQGTVRDRRLYSMFTPELTVAMTEETRRLASNLVWTKGNFMEFFSAPYSFLNADLAKLYKLPEPKEEYGRVDLPADTERAGVLSQASFLTMTSKPAETSPTARGLFIREQFLCQDVPQPPPGVNANLPPVTREKPMTQRERLGVHLSNPGCASCHSLIDPIGLAFEKFDAVGGYRPKMKLTIFPARFEKNTEAKNVELDIDTKGNVAGLPDASFTTPRELGMILASSPACQQCVAKQLFRYMSGRHEGRPDRIVIGRAFEDFKKSGFQFTELMVSLMKWSTYPPQKVN
ncbi:MAG: DUF1592 domain-containing protein [Bryobacterales bacterium]|nr:DUF1592 domain-containing protein [Bryobacterales bacterium]